MKVRILRSRPAFAGLLLLAGLALWACTAWPLPRLFTEAIPHTNLNPEVQTVSPLVPGDHLQLLYRFWLGLDALTGHSPWFHNIYEFNLGDDAARHQPYLYYLPFSLVYMAVAPLAGHAAGWNAAGLLSFLIAMLGLGLLARNFSRSSGAALWATLVAASFPFCWIPLFTGSPTGFGMAFPPLLFYGLDQAIRNRSAWGGGLAGLAMACSYMSDLHVFFFSMLATPAFALLSLLSSQPDLRRWPGEIRPLLRPLLPFVLLCMAALAISTVMNRQLSGSVMASGRSLTEMAAFSPPARGLVSTARAGMANHVYFGIPLFVLLGVLLALWRLARVPPKTPEDSPPPCDGRVVGLLVAGMVIVILLALGIHGPLEGLPVRLIRRAVPKYVMIRQTVKIYCLMPTLLAPLLGLLFGRVLVAARRSAWGLGAGALVVLLSLWTVSSNLAQTTPGLCRLPHGNLAYEAVANDTQANAGRPHALALPLWPGDSHWSSLYEYAIMQSRVRLVNGYTPAVPAGYFEDVFVPYASLNQGYAGDEQLDGLLAMGVRHLLLHTQAYPEKVSPFPAAAALRALIGHPRLALLADDGQIFAFRILPRHPVEHVPHANWTSTLHAASRHWSWNPPREIPNAQTLPLLLRSPVGPAPNRRYLLHLAEGSSQPLLTPPGSRGSSVLTHPVPGLPDWLEAELPSPTGGQAHALSGTVFLQHALITAGELPSPGPDGVIRIPPALLFHNGHSSPGQDAVTFDPTTVPAHRALYGPNLPFPPGTYNITFVCRRPEDPRPARPLGIFRILTVPDEKMLAEAALDSSADGVTIPAVTVGAAPLRFEFHYAGQAPVILRSIQLAPATLRLVPAS